MIDAKPPVERCSICDEPTGKAGCGDGSLYTDGGIGPLCESCLTGAQGVENILQPRLDALLVLAAKGHEEREGTPISARYWRDQARQAPDSATRILCLENAYNHVENALFAAKRPCICDKDCDEPCPVHTPPPDATAQAVREVGETMRQCTTWLVDAAKLHAFTVLPGRTPDDLKCLERSFDHLAAEVRGK